MKMNRRNFLKNSAATASVLAFPTIVPSSVLGKDAPSNKVHIASIGVGNQGGGLLRNASYNKNAVVVAVCDCFASRRENAKNTIKNIYKQTGRENEYATKGYADFREVIAREDIDGCIVATPDHWHVPVAFHAVGAGKDVYVEKPLGVSFEDSFKLRKLVQDKKAIFQYGTQQRSDYYFRFSCELARNGYLGEVKTIDSWCGTLGFGPHIAKKYPLKQDFKEAPADLDYDRWIGPAPMSPYCDLKVTKIGAWHMYDYALGFIAGWGAHPLDIAQWGNNTENTAPILYEGTGKINEGTILNTVATWDLNCTYANGVKMRFMDADTAMPVVKKYHPRAGGHGTTFHGTEGWVSVRRGTMHVSDEKIRRIKLKDSDTHLYQSKRHVGNFIDCIKTRKQPISTIEAAVQSDLISHMGNAVVRLGRSIKWDPKKEQVIGDPETAKILNRKAREPWSI